MTHHYDKEINMQPSASQEGALTGIKVLDLSRVLAGPSATQILGDLGADVIKIENPQGGDDTRSWGPPFIKDHYNQNVESAYFSCCNRNKRSVALDFKNPEDLQTIINLAQKADILVENFKPKGLEKYQLDYKSLNALNSRLIYCSITGFGQSGPYAHRAGYDFLIQGMGGLMSITGQADGVGAEPMKVGVAICDLFTGMNAVTSILAALQFRHRTGQGQHIDCALLDHQVAMLANQSSNWLNCAQTPQRMGNHHPSIAPYRVFKGSDGHLIINCGNDGQFQRLCSALEMPWIAQDSRFINNEVRCINREVLDHLLSDHLQTRQISEILSLLELANVPCGPINDIPTIFNDEHLKSRQMEVSLQREDGVLFSSVAYPAKLSLSPAQYRQAPPKLGAHNEVVLREWGVK